MISSQRMGHLCWKHLWWLELSIRHARTVEQGWHGRCCFPAISSRASTALHTEEDMKAFLIAAVMVTPLVALAHGNEKAVDAANYTPAQLVGKLKAKDKMHTELGSLAQT